MMKNKFMIIDGNNMLYRAYYKFTNLRTQKGVLSGVIYGFPLILNAVIKQHLPDDVIVVFDGGRDKERTKLWPDYKKSRGDKKINFDSDNFYFQKSEVVKMLMALGIKIVEVPKREADDVIWMLTKKLKIKNQVIIVSSDKDFNQLISQNVSIWNPKAANRLTHKNLQKEVGYTPEQCVDRLIMEGDDSDNIPGLVGVGAARARDFLEKHNSIESYLKSNCEELKSFPKNRLEEVFLRNRILIDIRLFCRRYFDKNDLQIMIPGKKVNRTEFNMVCSNYEISSFNEGNFIRTFEKLLKNNDKNKLVLKYLKRVSVIKVKLK